MRLFVVLLTLFMLALPVVAQEDPGVLKSGYVGFAYDDHKSNLATGFAFHIWGDLYNFTGFLYSKQEQTASIEFAYLFDLNTVTSLFGVLDKPIWEVPSILQRLRIGPVAGPNVRWEEQPDANPLMRVLGAAGAIAHYPLAEQIGVWVFWKHRFALEDSSFLDRNTFAGGVSYNL